MLGSCAISIKSPSTTLMNFVYSSHCWPRQNTQIKNLTKKQMHKNKGVRRSLTQNLMPPQQPQRSSLKIQSIQRKWSTSSTHNYGCRGLHYISFLTMVVRSRVFFKDSNIILKYSILGNCFGFKKTFIDRQVNIKYETYN